METMGSRKRILIIDDEVNVLFVMHDALAKLGDEVEIVTAQGGYEAMRKAVATTFDLIITDLKMPDLDGVELTRAVKTLNPDTIVIWMTAYGYHKVSDTAARLMVYRCLDKPVEVAEIRRIVREALAGTEDQNPIAG
jgi:DNA-binding NtrC family response regulator